MNYLLIIAQILITVTAPTAIFLAGKNYKILAPIVGLISQVGFFSLFFLNHQYIMFIPTTIYTFAWLSWFRKD